MKQETPHEAEVSVTFSLEGAFSPGEITESTGLMPTRTGGAGELVGGVDGRRRARSMWEIRSQTDETVRIGDQVSEILRRLAPHWQEFIDLGKRYEAGFRVRVYSHEAQGPELYFEKEILRRVAQLNAYIDVDFYCVGGDDGGDPRCSGQHRSGR